MATSETEKPKPVDYRHQPLEVGTEVTFVSEINAPSFSKGVVVYLGDEQVCVDSGGLLVLRKAKVNRHFNLAVFESIAITGGDA